MLLIVSVAACTSSLAESDDAFIQCSADSECPDRTRCNLSTRLCVATDRTDVLAPSIVDLAVDDPFLTLDETATLTLTVNERLAEAGSLVRLEVDSGRSFSPLLFQEQVGSDFVYTASYFVDGTESQTVVPLVAVLEDTTGNRLSARLPVELEFDFGIPSLVDPAPTVTVFPDPAQNPLATDVLVSQIGNPTTTLSFSFSVSEDVLEPVLRIDSQPLEFVFAGRVGDTWSFSLRWPAEPPQIEGTFNVQTELVDIAGNTSGTVSVVLLELDSIPPGLPSVEVPDQIRFVRAPWGRLGSGGEAEFAVEGETGSVGNNEWLLVYDDPQGAREIARVQSGPDGAFGGPNETAGLALPISDREVVYVRAADDAGNLSPVVPVRDIVWIANGNRRVSGNPVSNPHALSSTPYLASFLGQGGVTEISDLGLGVEDDVMQPAPGGATWTVERSPSFDGPAGAFAGVAFNPINGRTLQVGGETFQPSGSTCGRSSGDAPQDVRAPRRGVFEPFVPDPASFSLLSGISNLVFDGTRGRVMYLGSGQAVLIDDRWQRECAGPTDCGGDENRPSLDVGGPLISLQATYDSVRDRVVVLNNRFDGLRVHEWDGQQWTRLCTSAPCSDTLPDGTLAAAAFDEGRESVVLFGLGSSGQETWEWSGEAFNELCIEEPCLSTRPPARILSAMVFDRANDALLMFGGDVPVAGCSEDAFNPSPTSALNDTWLFQDGAWTQGLPTTVPPVAYGHRLIFDATRNRVVMRGGTPCRCEGLNGQWEWNGSDWQASTSVEGPPSFLRQQYAASAFHTMTTDPRTGRVFAFNFGDRSVAGNFRNDPWVWRAPEWFAFGNSAQERPGARAASLSPLGVTPTGGLFVFSGGTDFLVNISAPSEQRVFAIAEDGRWTPACAGTGCTAGAPSARFLYDWASDGDGLVLFGGSRWTAAPGPNGPPEGSIFSRDTNDETWRFDGSGWSRLCSAAPCSDELPARRAGHRMSYGGSPGEVLLYGGANRTDSALDDTWLWREGRWERFQGEGPPARAGHSLTWIPELASTVLVGGTDRPATEFGPPPDVTTDPQEHAIPTNYADVWRWDGGTWSMVPTVSPNPMDAPVEPRYHHDAAWDPENEELFVYGGYQSPVLLTFGAESGQQGKVIDARVWSPEFNGRPALLFSPALSLIGTLESDELVSFEVEWRGIASSTEEAGASNRAAILAWAGTHWEDLGAVPCGDDCERANSSTVTLSSVARSDGIRIALTTAGSNGMNSSFARFDTDYFELRVRYRR